MKITKLEPQKNHASRYNLEIDDKFECGMDEALITELDLYVSKEIVGSTLDKIRESDDYYKCLNKGFLLISIRMNAENELKKKLIKHFSYQTVNKVLIRLKELNYVNDEVFVKNWVSTREGNRGMYLLKKELLNKGIGKDLIESFFVNRSKETELENAKRAISRKRLEGLTKEEKYQKIGSFLSRRGFDYETIKRAIDEG